MLSADSADSVDPVAPEEAVLGPVPLVSLLPEDPVVPVEAVLRPVPLVSLLPVDPADPVVPWGSERLALVVPAMSVDSVT